MKIHGFFWQKSWTIKFYFSLCAINDYKQQISLFFAYLSSIINEKDCGKLDCSMFWDLLEQQIQMVKLNKQFLLENNLRSFTRYSVFHSWTLT